MSATPQSRIEIAALVLRVSLGVLFLAHGLTKLFVYTLPGTAQFFESVGFPGVLAYPVTLVEIVGGTMLLLGVYSGAAALALVPVAIGATTAHWANGWVFTNAGGGWEFTAFLAVAGLVYSTLGTDGALSVASLIRGRQGAGRLEPQRS